jgi:hypothetical protein
MRGRTADDIALIFYRELNRFYGQPEHTASNPEKLCATTLDSLHSKVHSVNHFDCGFVFKFLLITSQRIFVIAGLCSLSSSFDNPCRLEALYVQGVLLEFTDPKYFDRRFATDKKHYDDTMAALTNDRYS